MLPYLQFQSWEQPDVTSATVISYLVKDNDLVGKRLLSSAPVMLLGDCISVESELPVRGVCFGRFTSRSRMYPWMIELALT